MGEILSIETRISEATRRWPQIAGRLEKKNSTEAAGPCPICGVADDDGFLVFSKGNYWCRRCSAKGWIDENNPGPLSEEELRELRLRALEHQAMEQERRLSALEKMHNCKDHLKYHDNLDENKRQLWYESGIYDEAIEKFQLGYAYECPVWRSSPSLTIPVYDYESQLSNIRHRLLNPNGKGKYRPHMSGLPNMLFNAPILRDSHDRLILVEGEKKTVCFDQAGYPTVGIMGKRGWKKKWFDWFDVGELYIALDPDADESAQKLGEIFAKNGFNNVRVADFPMKPDDFLYQYGASQKQVERILKLARPIH